MTALAPTNSRRLPLGPPAVVAALGAAAAILVAVAVWQSAPLSAARWGGAALAAWCAAILSTFALLAGRSGTGLAEWKVGPWFLIWCGVTSGLATIAWGGQQSGIVAQITPSSVVRAEWLTAAAVTGWAGGYIVGPRKLAIEQCARCLRSLAGRRFEAVRGPLTPWLLYAIGTIARLAVVATTGRLGYAGDAASAVSSASGYQQVLSLIGLLAPAGVAVAALRAFGNEASGGWAVLTILLAAEFAWSAISGIKGGFVTVFLAVAIPWATSRRRLPLALAVAGVIGFLALVIPFSAAYRIEARGGPTTLSATQAAEQAPTIARSTASAVSPAVIGQSLAYLAQRLSEINPPAVVVQKTPSQIPWASPLRLPESLVASMIPRSLARQACGGRRL